MTGSWLEPSCCTVTGAAHRRRGQPCQDASLARWLAAPDGGTLQLLAVADGHGNRRHWLSGQGSTLACQAAERAVRQAVASTPLPAIERWRELLQQGLPEAIVQEWLSAIAADWASQPEAAERPFSPLPYGSTLGLVLLAPRWWGCTGLGDWDLVQISATGEAQLISEETSLGMAGASPIGEATASLCLPGAAALFADRAQLQPLPAKATGVNDGIAGQATGQALVLSSDGMRKSCLTDTDFLQLCSQLSQIADPEELEAGLAQITAEGSGDDVSVAIGRQGNCWAGARPGQAALTAVVAGGAAMSQPTERTGWQRKRLALLLALGSSLMVGGGWWWWACQSEQAHHAPAARVQRTDSSMLPAPVVAEIRRLCAAPDRIRANLNQRRPQFAQLLRTPENTNGTRQAAGKTAATRPIAAHLDPLGALIAASRHERIPGCSQLEQELRMQWQKAAAQPAAANQPGRMPAENRRPAVTPETPTPQP